jgi:lambda repressor-like predicted transcriptional regulator
MSAVSESHRLARRHTQSRRRRLRAIGEWQDPHVDAEPTRQHVLAIRAAGMSEAALIRRLNLPSTALRNVMRGANGRPPGKTVLRETAEAVLAYWPALGDFPDTASIDPTGTLRRVHALEALGWSKRRTADAVGYAQQNLKTCLRQPTVSARLARRIAAVYDQWWNQRPEDHGVQPYVADRVRRYAAANGYYGPLAWDDDTIDDPKAGPATDAVAPIATEGGNVADRWLHGEAVILGAEDRKQVLQHLMEWTNDTPQEIAAQLEISLDTLWQTWSRLKKQARQEGRREPWRRVYVPRDRTLNQTEMEEAA